MVAVVLAVHSHLHQEELTYMLAALVVVVLVVQAQQTELLEQIILAVAAVVRVALVQEVGRVVEEVRV
jgi:hypothetical protein